MHFFLFISPWSVSSYFGRKFDAPPLSLLAFDPGICFQHFCCTLFYPWDVISKATKKKAKLYLHLPFERADQKEKKTNKFYPIFAMLHWCMRVRACVFSLYMYHTMVNKWKPMFLFFLHTFESRWSNVFPLEAHSQRWCIIITNTICWGGGGGKKSGTVFFGILLPDEE